MKCIECGSKEFEEKMIRCENEIHGERIEVEAMAWVCMRCKEALMDGDQMDSLRKSVEGKDKKRGSHLEP